MLVGTAFVLPSMASAAGTTSSIQVTGDTGALVPPQPGAVFIDTTVDVGYSGGPVLISSTPDGTGSTVVDDVMQVDITRPDGTVSTYTHDYSNGCSGITYPGPLDIQTYLATGHNSLRFRMMDGCGGNMSSSPVYVVFDTPVADPTPTVTPTVDPTPDPTPSPTQTINPAPPPTVSCPKLQFVGVRGSGETNASAGGYGDTVAAVKSTIEAKVPGTASQFIDYRAIPVGFGAFAYGSDYVASLAEGHQVLDRFLTQFMADCPQTYVVLAGYSQGAQVVGDEFEYLTPAEKTHVAAVALIGDPRFNPKQPRVDDGTYSKKLSGIYQIIDSHMRVIDKQWAPTVRSYCSEGDPICNYSKGNLKDCFLDKATCPHLLYATGPTPGLSGLRAVRRWRSLPPLV